MGYIRHHAIVVTTWNDDIKIAHDKAVEIFDTLVSPVIPSHMNGYASFFIAPDGSKEGWEDSNRGDENRKAFIEYLNTLAFEDDSNQFDYCEFFYGDDEGQSEVVNHN